MIPKKFVEECIYGIQASGDTKLSSIVRAIDDDIRPIYTEERLSRNMDDEVLKIVKAVYAATGGKGVVVYDRGGDRPAFYDYFIEENRDFIVRLKGRSVLSWGGMHEVHDLARQCTMPRRSSSCRASPSSSTPTTDSRFGRETPKTTSRNALQPLSMRVRRISALKKWVNSSSPEAAPTSSTT